MGLWDWVFVLSCLSISGVGVVLWIKQFPPNRKLISASLQAEIDQTPEWWDNEFRKLQGLAPLPFSDSEIERWKDSGITEVWDGDFHYSFRQLVDINPPTIDEIWTPRAGDTYDLSVDLATMSSTIQEAREKKDD